MKSKKLALFLTLSLILTGALAFAQDAPKEEESPMKVSGQIFTSINMNTGYVPNSTMALNFNPMVNFSMDRVYLKFDHELGKVFSYHVIFDVGPDVFTSTTTSITATSPTANNSYVAFLKNAFLRTKGGLDDILFFKFDLGIFNTPVIANRSKMADTRWLEKYMYAGGQNTLIGMVTSAPGAINKGVDSTATAAGLGDYDKAADLGISLEIAILKMFTLTAAVSVGEGWANISKDTQSNYAGKAWYGDLFVEPIKGLYFHGFMRFENVQFLNAMDQTTKTSQGKDAWFAGGGVGINMMGIRVGADFESGQVIIKNTTDLGGDQAKNFFVLNAWLNWNLNEIAGFPMLVIGRFAYGMYNDALAPYGSVASGKGVGVVYDTVFWLAGLGWQFNKNVRVVLFFEMYMYSDAEIYMAMGLNPYYPDAMAIAKAGNSGWNNSAHALKLATEVKF